MSIFAIILCIWMQGDYFAAIAINSSPWLQETDNLPNRQLENLHNLHSA